MSFKSYLKIIIFAVIALCFYRAHFYRQHLDYYSMISIAIFIGYFFGSFTGGPIFAKIFKLGDLKSIGSGNIGTTNVLRTGNKSAALCTLLFDSLKAVFAIKIIPFIFINEVSPQCEYFAAFGCLIGHFAPLFNDFKGGKGIATLAGISVTFSWRIGLCLFALWLFMVAVTRYSSVGGMTAVIFAIPICYFMDQHYLMCFFIMATPLVLWKHSENINRLIEGRETRIGNGNST